MALIRKRETTKKDDKERIREVSKRKKKSIRDKKSERQRNIQNIIEEMKGTKNIANIKSAKRRILIPKISRT